MYCNIDLDQFLMFFYFFLHLHIYISNIYYLGFRLLFNINGTTSSWCIISDEFWSASWASSNGIHMLAINIILQVLLKKTTCKKHMKKK